MLPPLQGFEPSNRPGRSKSLYRLRHRGRQNPPCPRHFTPLFEGTSSAYPKCSQSAVGHRDITEVCRHTLLRSSVSKRTFHRPLYQRFILHTSRPLMNCGSNYLVLWHPHQRDLLSFLLIVVRNNYKVPVTLKPCIANPSINVAFVIPSGACASVRVTREHYCMILY